MAGIGELLIAIGAAIAAAAAAVAAAIAAIAAAVAAAIAAAAAAIGAAISATVAAVSAAITDFAIGFSTYMAGGFTLADFAGTAFMTQVGAFVASLSAAVGAFLEAIHFKVIMAIHEVAYIMSEEYREIVNKVFSKISQVSAALGLGANFMTLALMNVRSVVLHTSAIFGRGFDIGEITWIKELNNFLKDFSKDALKYKDKPNKLLWAIDDALTRPYIDSESVAAQTLLIGLDSTLKAVKAVVDDMVRVKGDFLKLVADLPGKMRNEIKPYIEDVLKTWNTWEKDIFKPSLKAIDASITYLDKATEDVKGRVKTVTERIRNPGQYIFEIDALTDYDRLLGEAMIGNVSGRQFARETEAYSDLITEKELEWTGVIEKLFETFPTVESETATPPAIAEREKTEVKPRAGWSVGDY